MTLYCKFSKILPYEQDFGAYFNFGEKTQSLHFEISIVPWCKWLYGLYQQTLTQMPLSIASGVAITACEDFQVRN